MKSMLGAKVGALRQVSRAASRLSSSHLATSASPLSVLPPLRSTASRLPTSRQVIGGTKLHTPSPLFESRNISTSPNAMASATPSGTQATKFPAEKELKQQEDQPGKEHKMEVKPETIPKHYKPAGKLEGKKALITGGDSGIGRAIAALYAMEGADVGITYVEGHEEKDAEDTLALVEEVSKGQRKATKYATDLGYDENCKKVAEAFLKDHGKIDILVNHAGEQHAVEKFEDLSPETVERTFRTNVYSQFFLTRHLLPHMPEGSVIINTASVNAYKGNKTLIDYTASKGANVAFTRALALNLAERNIRVNGVAPGPIWTPLISATFPEKKVASFGEETPLGRAGHPSEVAPAYVFLASADASYITGQVIHPNGGMVVNA